MKIDVFNHFSPAPYFDEVCRLVPQHPAATLFRRLPQLFDIDARLRLLDAIDDYAQLLCLANPPIEAIASTEDAPRLARLGNDALAAAFGVEAHRVASPGALRPVLATAIGSSAPVLIEVEIEEGSEASPWEFIHFGR